MTNNDEDSIHKIKVQVKKDYYNDDYYGFNIKDQIVGASVQSVSISNDGKYYILYKAITDNSGKCTYSSEIYSVKDNFFLIMGSLPRDLQWMPVSTLAYYIKDNDLYVVNPKEKTVKVIYTKLPEGQKTFLKNEKQMILSIENKKDNTEGDLRRIYMPDDRMPGWRNRTTLALYDLETNSLQPLTFGCRSTWLNDINIQGTKILFSASKDSITTSPFVFNSLYQMDLNTMQVDTLVYMDEAFIYAKYIPNSENIAILASNNFASGCGLNVKKGQKANLFNQSLYIMNIKTKKVNPVSKYFDPSVNSISVKNDNLYLTCVNKDSVSVFKYSLKNNTFSLVDLDMDVVQGFDIDSSQTNIVFCGQKYNKPNYAAYLNTKDNKIQEVCFPKEVQYKNMKLGLMENYSFKSKDGSQIDGRLYFPYNFDKTKKYPMIVYYYGGCEPTDRSFEWRYSAYLYTNQGYLVYVINPSGTIGWGQEFAARHTNAWGDYTADEIIEGVKKICKEKPFIDSRHIGCMGASYGGFMTQYLQTKTNIFACAVSHAGISNITSYWGEGYWGYSYSAAASTGSYPWNNPELYTKHSPLFNADKIHTPLLLLHGTSDTNVPIGESIQMYNALKILGREVEFITVKGENHGIVDFNKRQKWNNTIFAWFAKYLKNDSSWWDSLYPKEEY